VTTIAVAGNPVDVVAGDATGRPVPQKSEDES
jgi:hypothetical protein